jgi:hypothetical protein
MTTTKYVKVRSICIIKYNAMKTWRRRQLLRIDQIRALKYTLKLVLNYCRIQNKLTSACFLHNFFNVDGY